MIRRLFLLLSLCLPLSTLAAEELLEVDKAFRLSARAVDAATLEVRYDIAKGYYMYRDKFATPTTTPAWPSSSSRWNRRR